MRVLDLLLRVLLSDLDRHINIDYSGFKLRCVKFEVRSVRRGSKTCLSASLSSLLLLGTFPSYRTIQFVNVAKKY